MQLRVFLFLCWAAGLILPAGIVRADEMNIRYGATSRQALDVYAAVGGQKADRGYPVVVWVHGGGWRHGDKDNRNGIQLCETWARQGIVVVNLNYRLTPDVVHPAHAEDVAAGIAWVHGNIARYQGDPRRIHLLGHSAGAHLVALVATNPRFLQAHDLAPNAVLAGVMPIDTASYDLTTTSSRLVRKMIRDAFGENAVTLADASPLGQARAHQGACPPFLIAVAKQRREAWEESSALQKALPKAKLIVMDYPEQGQLKAHGAIARDLMDPANLMTKQLLAFVQTGKW